MKVLTVQFDVTHLTKVQLKNLVFALEVQGEDVPDEEQDISCDAEHLRTSVREVDEATGEVREIQ